MVAFDTSLITAFFLLFGAGYLGALAYVVLLDRHRSGSEGEATDHRFSLIVPARNEASVLAATLDALLALEYPADAFEILVVDDGSADPTPAIAATREATHPGRVRALRLPRSESGRGKAAALNAAFASLRERSPFARDADWIVGVFDADGRPEPDLLRKASYQFRDGRVGGVQASVRIRNRDAAWLARMQDVEFAAFSRMTQVIRMRITNSASLGGNGQFVRAAALEDVAGDVGRGEFWKSSSLTEDLDLATRLALRNWDLNHLNTSRVWQEGVESMRSLLRQRTRWAWGSLQVFAEFVVGLKVLRTPHVQLRKRLDLLFTLTMFLVSPLVLLMWILSGLALLGIVAVASAFPASLLVLLSFAYLPIVGYGMASADRYPRARFLRDLVGFALYTYHWIPCLYVGLWHVVARHPPRWWKTARSGEPAGG
jgi:cellulose synthase/poly-beta-1,6-N-acetylglucosamine synthase-like glycosyltransferase